MTSKKLDRLKREMDEAEAIFAKAKLDYRTQEVAECDHDWNDESFESYHNGNWEVFFRCKNCGTVGYKDPKHD